MLRPEHRQQVDDLIARHRREHLGIAQAPRRVQSFAAETAVAACLFRVCPSRVRRGAAGLRCALALHVLGELALRLRGQCQELGHAQHLRARGALHQRVYARLQPLGALAPAVLECAGAVAQSGDGNLHRGVVALERRAQFLFHLVQLDGGAIVPRAAGRQSRH